MLPFHTSILARTQHMRTEVTRLSEDLHHQIHVSTAERKEFKASIIRTTEALRKAEADRKTEGERVKDELAAYSEKVRAEQEELRNQDQRRLRDFLQKEESARKSESALLQFDVERVNGVLETAQEERSRIEAELNADKAKDGWYHPGEWVMQMHKGKFLEHWTWCVSVQIRVADCQVHQLSVSSIHEYVVDTCARALRSQLSRDWARQSIRPRLQEARATRGPIRAAVTKGMTRAL
jgi:hypothetical protein